MAYFKELLSLLELERQQDRRTYRELIERSSVQERRENGTSWYPIAIRDTEIGRGDYLTVEVERTTHTDVLHQLRFGAAAALFSQHDPSNNRIEGTISHQSGNRLKLSLQTDELPDWTRDGKLGIDLLFDENSYDEMQQALRQAASLMEKGKEGSLVRILTGEAKPSFDERLQPVEIPSLNAAQQTAVNRILAANELAIVHGPPGTGKTTTLVEAIRALLAREPQDTGSHTTESHTTRSHTTRSHTTGSHTTGSHRNGHRILVTAPSNTAVDLLTEKIAAAGIRVVRVGNPARVSERLMELSLDSQLAAHPSMKEVKKLKKQANEYRNLAHRYKRSFGAAEREQRRALFDEARKLMKDVERTEQYMLDDILDNAQVITATLVGANHYTVRNLRYKTVMIDEAGQAIEPACWVPILKAENVILAGDHCQLSPVIKSEEAARAGLSITLLEKCVKLFPEAVTMLEVQYRMHERIMQYSSSVFYDSKLKAHATVAAHKLYESDSPLVFIDTAGCGFEEKISGTAINNPEEAALLVKHLQQFTDVLKEHYNDGGFPTIGVISPYKLQVETLKDLWEHSPAAALWNDRISINTIDSFQGQERDIIYISMTRSNPDSRIGFLSEIRRMNVAMTRARKKLVIVGDSATLSQSPFYADFIQYAEEHDAYLSAWEFI